MIRKLDSLLIREVYKGCLLLTKHYDRIAWLNFRDPYFDIPYTLQEQIDESVMIAAVRIAMPIDSKLYRIFSRRVATKMGAKWIQYEVYIKAIARILMIGENSSSQLSSVE